MDSLFHSPLFSQYFLLAPILAVYIVGKALWESDLVQRRLEVIDRKSATKRLNERFEPLKSLESSTKDSIRPAALKYEMRVARDELVSTVLSLVGILGSLLIGVPLIVLVSNDWGLG